MYKLGMMQGRLYPENFSEYNVFPFLWKKEFSKLNSLGFNYIELLYDKKESTKNPLCNSNINYLSFKKETKNKIYSINLDYFTKNNFFRNLKENKKRLYRIISFSKKLKIKLIVIPCLESNFMSDKKLIIFIKMLKKILYKKKDPIISLEIENFQSNIYGHLNGQIGLCFDTGNLAIKSKNYLHDLLLHHHYINHIHLKDKKIKNKKAINCRLGTGLVNIKKIFLILKKLKYKGSITFETSFKKNPIMEAKKNLNFVRNLI